MSEEKEDRNLRFALDVVESAAKGHADIPLANFSSVIDHELIRCHVRLPNKSHQRIIQQHALAARTIRVRALKNPDSEAHLAVEGRLEPLEESTDEELRNWIVKQYEPEASAKAQVQIEYADPERNPEYREFAVIEEVKARYESMIESGDVESERFRETQDLIIEYGRALSERMEDFLHPLRMELENLDRDGLLKRAFRIMAKKDADEEYLTVYNEWELFYGTRDFDDPRKFYFASREKMIDETDDAVLEIIGAEFAKLNVLRGLEVKKSLAPIASFLSSEQSEKSAIGE